MYLTTYHSDVNPVIVISYKFGQYNFEMQASSGNMVLTSGPYRSVSACNSAIKSLKLHSRNSDRFEKLTNAKGQFYFVVKDTNNNIIATSELFWSASSRDYAIILVKREVSDITTVNQ